jgi:alkaline phosphatase
VKTFTLLVLALALLAAPDRTHAAQDPPRPRSDERPSHKQPDRAKSVIFMVTDGMSMGTLKLADTLKRQITGRPSHWMAWMAAEPGVRQGLVDTEPADGLVTDSAAAGSAWSIGELVRNGRINVTPDDRRPEPILLRAARIGKATGVVATARITHATPASFYANVERRNDEDTIAKQLIDRPIDIMLGGGARHFSNDLLHADPSLHVVRNANELRATRAASPPERMLGLFADSHMAYEIDRGEDEPSLAEMTAIALEHLSRDPDGFILQVEGARVDHAAHDNDAAAMLYDQIAFDDAVGVAIDYCRDNPDTLLLVTTDHGNANPGLSIYLEPGAARFARLREAKHSFVWIGDQWRELPDSARTLDAYVDLVHQATGVELSEREREILAAWLDGRPTNPFDELNRKNAPLGAVLANHTGVSFMSTHHTNDLVLLTAMGPGAERVRPLQSIADVHDILCAAAGIPLPPAPPADVARSQKRLWDHRDDALTRGVEPAPHGPVRRDDRGRASERTLTGGDGDH